MTSTRQAARGERRDAGRMRQRAHGAGKLTRSAPGGIAQARRSDPVAGQIRAQMVDYRGRQMYQTDGYFTIYGRDYEMYDWYGPYMERVVEGAGADSIADKPDVVFLLNHTGLAMARTAGAWNQNRGTLTVTEEDTGGHHVAYHNPERSDVQLMIAGMDDGVITEMSFAFMIEEGWWSDDFETYEIRRYNIHRGDVSAVNYGANPYTSVSARSNEILAQLDELPPGAIGEAVHRLSRRFDDWQTLLREADPGAFARVIERGRDVKPSEGDHQTADDFLRGVVKDAHVTGQPLDQAALGDADDTTEVRDADDDRSKVIDTDSGSGRTVAAYEALLESLGSTPRQ